MSVTALVNSSLRYVSRCLRTYSQSTLFASRGEAALQKALGAEGAYWSIGTGPHATYTAFRQMGQHTPRALTGPGRYPIRAYQSYNSFVRSYQYGWVVKGVSYQNAMMPAIQGIYTIATAC